MNDSIRNNDTIDDQFFIVGILEQLSLEIVIEIVSFLDRMEFMRLSRVNRFFNLLTEDRRFWLEMDHSQQHTTTTTKSSEHTNHHENQKFKRITPILALNRIQSHLHSNQSTNFKTIYKHLLLSPSPSELNQVAKNHHSPINTNLIPVTKQYIVLLGQPHSGRYSLGIYSTRGYWRPNDKKSTLGIDFFFKELFIKMENLSTRKGSISGIVNFKFIVKSFTFSDFESRNIGKNCFDSLTPDLSIMYTIDLSIRDNYFLGDLFKLLNDLFQVDISKDSPQNIRKKMGNNRLCLIGTKSDNRKITSFTLAQQLMKIIDTSCEFWDQSIIYLETSSKNRKNMDHPYLFFLQTNIHSRIL